MFIIQGILGSEHKEKKNFFLLEHLCSLKYFCWSAVLQEHTIVEGTCAWVDRTSPLSYSDAGLHELIGVKGYTDLLMGTCIHHALQSEIP